MIDGTLNGEKYAKEIIEKNILSFMKQHNNLYNWGVFYENMNWNK